MDTQDDSRFPFTWVDGKKAKLNECNGVVQSAEPGLGPRYLAKVLKRYPNDFLVGVVKDENQKKPSVAAIVINIQEDKNDVVEACYWTVVVRPGNENCGHGLLVKLMKEAEKRVVNEKKLTSSVIIPTTGDPGIDPFKSFGFKELANDGTMVEMKREV